MPEKIAEQRETTLNCTQGVQEAPVNVQNPDQEPARSLRWKQRAEIKLWKETTEKQPISENTGRIVIQ